MALREDEIILWDYQWIFLPVFIAHLYVLLACLVVVPLFQALYRANIYPTFSKTLLSVISKEATLKSFFVIGLPWLLTFFTFLVFQIIKESEGTISTNWILFPLGIYSTIAVFCCICICIIEKRDMIGYFLLILVYLYFAWLFSFIAAKSDFYFNPNWGITFIPIWIIIGGLSIIYCIACVAIISGGDQATHRMFVIISPLLLTGYFSILSWFILIAVNLEARDNDLPMLAWIVVHSPIIIAQFIAIIGIGILFYNISN